MGILCQKANQWNIKKNPKNDLQEYCTLRTLLTCNLKHAKNPTWIYDNCMYYKIYRFWVNNSLTKLRHCLSLHFCLILFGPPNFFISCQSKKKKKYAFSNQRGETLSTWVFDMHANTFEINMCILLWHHNMVHAAIN